VLLKVTWCKLTTAFGLGSAIVAVGNARVREAIDLFLLDCPAEGT